MERRLTTILAADVVGYGRLMGADEAGNLGTLKAPRRAHASFRSGFVVLMVGTWT